MKAPLGARIAPYVPHAVAVALLLAVSAAVIGVLAGLGSRLAWWHFSTGFMLLRWAARLGAAAGAVGLLGMLTAGLARRWLALALAVGALAAGLTVFGLPRYQLYLAHTVPPIHDITTDWEEPPRFQAVLPRRFHATNPPEYPGADVANQQRRFYDDIRPAHFREDPAAVFSSAEQAARDLGWEVVAAVPEEGRIEATDTTFWFGFRDDVVVRIRAEEGATRVDVRSKSRVGGSDIGANARRIRRFLERLRDRLTPVEGQADAAAPRGGHRIDAA